jgi:hypothetical protein
MTEYEFYNKAVENIVFGAVIITCIICWYWPRKGE